MGADLYIKNMEREPQYTGFEVSQRAVDVGYFRDCYNEWGLFSIMSATLNQTISWWQTSDIKSWFRKDKEDGLIMTVEGAKKWWAQLEPLLKEFIDSPKIYRNEYVSPGKSKRLLIRKKEDIECMKEHAHLLQRFIKFAIEQKSEIIWSV